MVELYAGGVMRTTVTLDESLLSELTLVSGEKTKTSAVNKAIREYIRRNKLQKLANLLGTFDIDESVLNNADKSDLDRVEMLNKSGAEHASKH